MENSDTIISYIFKPYNLKPAQLRVVKLLLAGLSNGQIAQSLGLQITSVKFQISCIYRLTNVDSRAQFLTKFQHEFNTLLNANPENSIGLIQELSMKLFICSTTHRSADEIKRAWRTSVAPHLSIKVSESLLKQLLFALNLT